MSPTMLKRTGHRRRRRCDIRFGFDPLGAGAASGLQPLCLERNRAVSAASAAKGLAAMGFKGPFAVADGRVIHDAGGSEAQELAFVLAVRRRLSARDRSRPASTLEDAHGMIYARLAADADQFLTLAKFRALRLLWARVETSLRPCAEAALHRGRYRVAHADPARSLCEHAARDHGDLLRRPRRRQCDHRAAAYAGARPARSFRAARRRATRNWCCWKNPTSPKCRSRGRLRRHRDADARAVRGGMGAVPGDREGRRPVCLARAEPDPAQGRSDPQGARGQYRKAPRRAHRRQRIPEPARGRHRCAAGKTGRARAVWRGEIQVRSASADAARRALRSAARQVGRPAEKIRRAAKNVFRQSRHRRRLHRPRRLCQKLLRDRRHRGRRQRRIFRSSGTGRRLQGVRRRPWPACARPTRSMPRKRLPPRRPFKPAGARHIYLAGRPGEQEPALRAAGIGDFIFAGGDALAALQEAWRRME